MLLLACGLLAQHQRRKDATAGRSWGPQGCTSPRHCQGYQSAAAETQPRGQSSGIPQAANRQQSNDTVQCITCERALYIEFKDSTVGCMHKEAKFWQSRQLQLGSLA